MRVFALIHHLFCTLNIEFCFWLSDRIVVWWSGHECVGCNSALTLSVVVLPYRGNYRPLCSNRTAVLTYCRKRIQSWIRCRRIVVIAVVVVPVHWLCRMLYCRIDQTTGLSIGTVLPYCRKRIPSWVCCRRTCALTLLGLVFSYRRNCRDGVPVVISTYL